MRAKPGEEIIREQWVDRDSSLARQPPEPVRTSRAIETVDAPAAPSPVASAEARVNEWTDRLQDLVDDELEAGEELSAVELIAEASGLLQNAVDNALDRLEREMASRFGAEIEGLHAKIVSLTADRAADQERHRREVAGLVVRMQKLELETRAEVGEAHDAVRLAAAEAAEGRSIERLRQSSWKKRHDSRVGMKLTQRELANAKGTPQ
jgi:hypothetical protein